MRTNAAKTLPIALLAATLGLFAAITFLQSRWVGQLSDAELRRTKVGLQLSLRTVQTEINRELSRAFLLFQWEAGAPEASWGKLAADSWKTWRRTAEHPNLIQQILIVKPGRGAELQMAAYRPER